ncbi:PAS domain S-box protein [Muricoccus radiodurans]|uniref:PAS domain S-box protein n=1 Tax=Muricoccus radiodurans TaxID=2231721 RepID=UPI003CEFBFE5
MARRIGAHDWAITPLGPIDGWPDRLLGAVETILAMPGPATVLWGPAHVQIYNDAYVTIARDRHPALLGRPVAEGWPEAYAEVIAPLLDAVRAGRTTQLAGFVITLRNPDGGSEERVFDTAWVPLRDEAGGVAGTLQTLAEVTGRHRAEATLRESERALAADLADTTLLRDLAVRLVTEEDAGTIHEEVLTAAIALTRADAGTVQIYDPGTRSLVLLATRNLDRRMTDHFQRVDADSRTACGMALRSGRRTFMDFDDEADEACRMHVAAGYHSAQATPLLSRSGRPLGMLNTHWRVSGHRPTERELRFLDLLARQAADLIEGREAQRVLRESEARFRGFAENSADVLWIADARRRRLEYLSPAFERIFGAPRAPILEGHALMRDLVHPDDHATFEAAWPRAVADQPTVVHYRRVRPSGETIHLRDTLFTIRDEAGTIRQVAGVVQDVTDMVAAQDALEGEKERFRSLAEGIPQLVWRSCDEGLWTWASPQWCGYTGQREEESHGWGWLEAVHPDDQERTMQAWHEARSHGRLDVECRVRRAADGTYRWHQTRSVPVRNGLTAEQPEGRIVEWLGTTTDIEDLKRLQGQQEVLVAELQHRTRNLLGVVRNVARRSIAPSPGRDEYDDRLATLGRVQGFLTRSTAWSVALEELVQAELKAVGDGHSAKVTVSGPPVELPGNKVEPVALALHELATNAMKYGALMQDSARLSVTWHFEKHSGADVQLVLEWRESGVEMPPGRPSRRGYGSELIERALPYQLKAETWREFTPDGVHCVITLPVNAIRMPEQLA